MEAKTSAEGFSGLRSKRAPVEGEMAAAPSVACPKERGPRGNFLNAYYDLHAAPCSSITNVSKFFRHANNSLEYEVLYYTNYLSISESLFSLFSRSVATRLRTMRAKPETRSINLQQLTVFTFRNVSSVAIRPDPSSIFAWHTSSDWPTTWAFSGLVANLLLVIIWVSVSHADFGISQILAPRLCNPLSARIGSLKPRFTKV